MRTHLPRPEDSLLYNFRLVAIIILCSFTILSYSLILEIKMNDIHTIAHASTMENQEIIDGGRINNNYNNNLSLANLVQLGSPYLGDPSTAPITIIDFSDFQCYLCARYVKATEPLINQSYIQTGKAALIFKHLPNRGFDSMDAALAAQCINDQGKFWQFHNMLYDNQKPIDSGWVSKDNLKMFASQIAG